MPVWFRQDIPDKITLERQRFLSRLGIHTVCQETRCPNLNFCFKNLRLTFMILGDICTRNCRFCHVQKLKKQQRLILDEDEPFRIARAVDILGLNYVVITSVTRDDLEDGGAGIFSQTIKLIHRLNKDIKIEVLIPDFRGRIESLKCILDASVNIVAHNIETVKRLYKDLRPKADYELSLEILAKVKELNKEVITKSSLMLGLGESEEEVVTTMKDLRRSHCEILTLGQYLAPSLEHYPVKEFISLEQFKRYKDIGLALGFKSVFSGPLVRSSYQAEEIYKYVASI
ncbi:MAG: lipoyl synthase [Candidatus Omnitrophica bacterium]|nr:lipoyl synthase [Candidatus Omnitrophota bacterium]